MEVLLEHWPACFFHALNQDIGHLCCKWMRVLRVEFVEAVIEYSQSDCVKSKPVLGRQLLDLKVIGLGDL